MLLINLNKIRPFDVLLTSTGDRISRLIKRAQSFDRGDARAGRYSHASLFVAPTLLLESNDPGITLVDVTNGVLSRILHQNPRGDEAISASKTNPLIIRNTSSGLTLFCLFPFAESAVVLRNYALDEKISSIIPESFRSYKNGWRSAIGFPEVLRSIFRDMLVAYLVKEYPSVGRLTRASKRMPVSVAKLFERIIGRFQRVEMPGVFCSELVAEFYITLGMLDGQPGSYAPSDFAQSDNFSEVDGAVVDPGGIVPENEGLTAQEFVDVCQLITPLGQKLREPFAQMIVNLKHKPDIYADPAEKERWLSAEMNRRKDLLFSDEMRHQIRSNHESDLINKPKGVHDLSDARNKYIEGLISRCVEWANENAFFWNWVRYSGDCSSACQRQIRTRWRDSGPCENGELGINGNGCSVFLCKGGSNGEFLELLKYNWSQWWDDPLNSGSDSQFVLRTL